MLLIYSVILNGQIKYNVDNRRNENWKVYNINIKIFILKTNMSSIQPLKITIIDINQNDLIKKYCDFWNYNYNHNSYKNNFTLFLNDNVSDVNFHISLGKILSLYHNNKYILFDKSKTILCSNREFVAIDNIKFNHSNIGNYFSPKILII